MIGDTYILSLWEAVELLEQVLIKHFTEEQEAGILKDLNSKKNWRYLLDYSNYKVSDEISAKLRNIKVNFSDLPKKKDAAPQKIGGRKPDTYSKLIYTIRQEVSRGVEVHLNNNQLEILLKYLDKSEDKAKYRYRPSFNPLYEFRYNFVDSVWVIYTWDYQFSSDGNSLPGLRKSILRFTNVFRVTFDTYRVREGKKVTYTGDFIKVGDYIKIRLVAFVGSQTWEEDLNFLFYIGNEKVDLALGQYRRIDTGSLLSGTAIMQRLQPDEASNVEARFDPVDSDITTDKMIVEYLKDKNLNYIKSPKITSLGEFSEWFFKQKKSI